MKIKLYGHLVCLNNRLKCCGQNSFNLEASEGITLAEIHQLIFINPLNNLVSIVNGSAQDGGYVINKSCSISIFPPMSDRKYNLFEKI